MRCFQRLYLNQGISPGWGIEPWPRLVRIGYTRQHVCRLQGSVDWRFAMDWWSAIWNEKDQEVFKMRFSEDAVCIGGAGSRFQGREAIASYQARNSGLSSDWTYETNAILLDSSRFAV